MIIDDVKTLLSIDNSSKDALLNIYIRKAETVIKNYLNNDTYDTTYIETNFSDAVVELVVNAYNIKANTKDGIKQVTQGSRSVVYKDSNIAFVIDDNVKSLLPKPFIKLM